MPPSSLPALVYKLTRRPAADPFTHAVLNWHVAPETPKSTWPFCARGHSYVSSGYRALYASMPCNSFAWVLLFLVNCLLNAVRLRLAILAEDRALGDCSSFLFHRRLRAFQKTVETRSLEGPCALVWLDRCHFHNSKKMTLLRNVQSCTSLSRHRYIRSLRQVPISGKRRAHVAVRCPAEFDRENSKRSISPKLSNDGLRQWPHDRRIVPIRFVYVLV